MTVDLYAVLVLLVIALAALLVSLRCPFIVLSALVLLLPFRDFSQRWLNAHTDIPWQVVNAFSRWWFVVILVLGLLAAVRLLKAWWAARRIPRPGAVDILLGLVLVVSGLATIFSPNLLAGFTSLRGYLQPMIVFVLARVFLPSRRELRTLLTLWLAAGVLVVGFALVQALTWDADAYRAEGYVRQDGQLVVPEVSFGGRSYLRPASTVSGPNELGLDMVILFLLAAQAAAVVSPGLRLLPAGSAVVFVAGLAVSYSRSAFLGMLTALASLAALWLVGRRREGTAVHPDRKASRWPVYALGMALAVLLLLTATGFFRLIWETITTLTEQYHYLDSVEAVRFLIAHPGGVGMGLVEPKGAIELLAVEGAFHVEGSIFQIALEMGVWGLAAWLAFWCVCLAVTIRAGWWSAEPRVRVFARTAVAGWLAALVAFLFLPLMQSITLMVWLWFLLGLGVESDRITDAWRAAPTPVDT
ncbi:MAG: O-antigen ligase family protein [Chloroflexota bacterium]